MNRIEYKLGRLPVCQCWQLSEVRRLIWKENALVEEKLHFYPHFFREFRDFHSDAIGGEHLLIPYASDYWSQRVVVRNDRYPIQKHIFAMQKDGNYHPIGLVDTLLHSKQFIGRAIKNWHDDVMRLPIGGEMVRTWSNVFYDPKKYDIVVSDSSGREYECAYHGFRLHYVRDEIYALIVEESKLSLRKIPHRNCIHYWNNDLNADGMVSWIGIPKDVLYIVQNHTRCNGDDYQLYCNGTKIGDTMHSTNDILEQYNEIIRLLCPSRTKNEWKNMFADIDTCDISIRMK